MTRALIIRHHEAETMGDGFRGILERRGFEIVPCNIFESACEYDRFDAPPLETVDLIMAFGGPMSVNDDLPALHAERDYLRVALGEGKPVFGVCLGAQMMATALDHPGRPPAAKTTAHDPAHRGLVRQASPHIRRCHRPGAPPPVAGVGGFFNVGTAPRQ